MALSNEQKLGLDSGWYSYWNENDNINKTMHCAYFSHWLPRLVEALENNKGSHLPSNWAQLGRCIHRDEKHLRRSKSSYQKAGDPEGDLVFGEARRKHKKQVVPGSLQRYAFSSALGIPESELSPSTADLIGSATKYLVDRHGADEAASESDCRAYGLYLSSGPVRPHHTQLDQRLVQRILEETGDWPDADVLSQAILRTARVVGGILLKDFRTMLNLPPGTGEE